jgi:hypothetical protein
MGEFRDWDKGRGWWNEGWEMNMKNEWTGNMA